jgi:hypothetical protein
MNSVSRLNELSQRTASGYPKYEFSNENRDFICACHFRGRYVSGVAAPSKKLAKESAATAALETLDDIMIVSFDPSPLWSGASQVLLALKKNGEEKRFVLSVA